MRVPETVVSGSRASRARGGPLSSKRVPRCLSGAKAMWLEHNYAQRFPQPRKGRKAEGLRYERKVLSFLTERYPQFLGSLPFTYWDHLGKHICIPDGILLGETFPVVFEVKLSHTLKAYWELSLLYRPVVSMALGRPVRVAEITQSYDPSMPIPSVNHKPFSSVEDFLSSGVNEGVILWRPK